MHFGLYLVKKGRITANQFVEALEAQLASRPQLGALAIETGKLSVRQVFHVLRMQADRPEEMFGVLAQEAGFLREDDLAALLDCQTRRVLPLIQVIVNLGFCTAYEAEELFSGYRSSTNAASRTQTVAAN